jgi:hypothetical protein
MSIISPEPIFCVVLGDAEHWSVEAEWPDGTIEQVDIFKAHFEAVNWLRTQSQSWLQSRGAF